MLSVLQEHLSYLTLPHRQALYQRAITQILRPGAVVADLGCGVGVLGIAALRAGASKAYGIDHSDAIELARESAARAGLADRYSCTRGSTFQTVLPEPVDLIICDHVGYFGFDYGIIAMLDDARRRMLRPGGQIMPRRLRLLAAGAQSTKARAQIDPWRTDPVPPEQHWLHEYALNSKQVQTFTADDICTDAVVLGEIDLTIANPASFAFSTNLTAARDARIDGLACWFECELAEGVWMTNSPLDEASIGRSNAFFAARDPFAVTAGDPIAISFRLRPDDNLIAWTIQPPGGLPKHKLSTWAGQILAPVDLQPNSQGPLALTAKGTARALVLGLVDGQRSGAEIEEMVLHLRPDLFPTEDEIRRFVRRQLATDASA